MQLFLGIKFQNDHWVRDLDFFVRHRVLINYLKSLQYNQKKLLQLISELVPNYFSRINFDDINLTNQVYSRSVYLITYASVPENGIYSTINYYVIVITLLILRLGKLYYEWKSYIIPETIHLGTAQNIVLRTGVKPF